MRRLIRILDALVTRDALTSQLRMLRVPYWPWDSAATLRRRLEIATLYGTPEGGDLRWRETVEGRMMLAELRLMRALGVARDGGGA